MKRIIIALLALICLICACGENTGIGVIGGADGPTAILISGKGENVKGRFGEQYEKRAVRMFNVDGELYYDSELLGNMTARCGTLDGNLKKAVGENEIPLKPGEANFEAEGYQHATSITKEVNIDGEWVIFKKYDTFGADLDGLKYCYYIKGHLNNAAVDSEIIVLSEESNVTFNDIYDPLLSSKYVPDSDKGVTHFNSINSDKWGVTLYADAVTPKGMILKLEQFGGKYSGTLHTGSEYSLETAVDDEWKTVETITEVPLVWNSMAYKIKSNDITEMKIDWQYGYGKLKPGYYRIGKKIMDFREAGDYDEEIYYVYFTIE